MGILFVFSGDYGIQALKAKRTNPQDHSIGTKCGGNFAQFPTYCNSEGVRYEGWYKMSSIPGKVCILDDVSTHFRHQSMVSSKA